MNQSNLKRIKIEKFNLIYVSTDKINSCKVVNDLQILLKFLSRNILFA